MSEGFERGRIAGIRQSSAFLLNELCKLEDDASQELLSFGSKTCDALNALASQLEAWNAPLPRHPEGGQ